MIGLCPFCGAKGTYDEQLHEPECALRREHVVRGVRYRLVRADPNKPSEPPRKGDY